MTTQIGTSREFPSDWAQVYALGYAEVLAILESIFDDCIDEQEARQLFTHHLNQHVERTSRLAREIMSELERPAPKRRRV